MANDGCCKDNEPCPCEKGQCKCCSACSSGGKCTCSPCNCCSKCQNSAK